MKYPLTPTGWIQGNTFENHDPGVPETERERVEVGSRGRRRQRKVTDVSGEWSRRPRDTNHFRDQSKKTDVTRSQTNVPLSVTTSVGSDFRRVNFVVKLSRYFLVLLVVTHVTRVEEDFHGNVPLFDSGFPPPTSGLDLETGDRGVGRVWTWDWTGDRRTGGCQGRLQGKQVP